MTLTTNKSNQSVRTFKDLNLDFDRNTVTNDVVKIEDVEYKRSVRNLVNTNFYERPFHPGCGIRQLLFEPFTPITSIFIRRKVEEVITNYGKSKIRSSYCN